LAATDVIFAIDESSDLGLADLWVTALVTEEILSTADGVQQVKATLALPQGTLRAFARVKLTLVP
jgi:cyanate lyase